MDHRYNRFAQRLAAAIGWACATTPIMAAVPQAGQVLYNVASAASHGATNECSLSFISAWSGVGGRSFAAVGTVTLAATADNKLGSTLTVRTNLNKTRRTISFAWMDVPGVGDTRGFAPPEPDQTGPFFSYALIPDPKGAERLRTAARHGFLLGLRVIGLTGPVQVHLPAAPKLTLSRLDKCIQALNGSRGH